MNRTALRLATLAAMVNGGAEPWPTLAKDYVYDSRRDPLDDVIERMRRPVIVIRTDDDMRSNRGPNGMHTRQQSRTISLLLEISVVTASKEKIDGADQWVVGWPQTDPSLEATLDMLEYQAENALHGMSEWALWFQSLRVVPMEWQSRPEFTREPNAVRLAARTITVPVLVSRECLPSWRFEDEDPAPAEPPPLLAMVLDRILTKGSGDLLVAAQEIASVLDARGWPNETAFPQLLRLPTRLVLDRIGTEFQADLRAGQHRLALSTRTNSQYAILFEDI